MRPTILLVLSITAITRPGLAAPAPGSAASSALNRAAVTASDTSPPSFVDRVIPVLTRTGCNSGACHGAASGKNGFRLSLLGYDPDLDRESLLRGAGGRRVTRTNPGASLLLSKPTGAVPHAGGVRFQVGSPEFNVLAEWIAAGSPGPRDDEATVRDVAVSPALTTLPVGGGASLRVMATYSDGSRRDVTWLSRFVSNHEHLARVDGSGRATMTGVGEAVIRAAFRGQVAVARLVVPSPVKVVGDPWALPADAGPLDRAIFTKLRRLRLAPAELCSDTEFLRRAHLDLVGTVPTPEKVRSFTAECDAERRARQTAPIRGPHALSAVRARLVDELIASPEFVDVWTYRLGDLLRSNRRNLGTKGNRRFHAWLREQVAGEKPWNQVVQAMLTSRGSLWDEGPANFYGTASGATELAEVTSQQFLGVRLQCAKCHDHPFDRWTQSDYYRFAAFFARTQVKNGGERDDRVVVLQDEGEVNHPKTGAAMPPRSLDGKVEAKQPDRRADLAGWLTATDNPWFARSMANRLWKHLMGRGLIDPVDDLRASNPASNEEALVALEQEFLRSGFQWKAILRQVATSRTYQLRAETNASNRYDETQFSHHVVRRLTAEQIMDALVAATGVPERFSGQTPGTRAVQLPDTSVPSYLLDLFGRPARANVCECEREADPNLAQVLHVMNGETINGKLAAPNGRLVRLLAENRPDPAIVEELFLATLTRLPSSTELHGALEAVRKAPVRRDGFADLFWALLNSREFLFTH